MTVKPTSERESWLVLRAQSGDGEAFGELLKAVQSPLYRYILSLTREPALAEDILQEVFIRIHRKLSWLREPEVFQSWAYQIATREAFRHLKRERRWADQVRDEDALKLITAPALPEEFESELIENLPRMVIKLSPASRAVIVLYYLHEKTLDETAAILGIPIGTVKSRLAYGLESLRRQFKKET